MTLYLVRPLELSNLQILTSQSQENIPTPPGSSPTPHHLSLCLSQLLSTQIQRVVLPPLFDPSHPRPAEPTPGDQSSAFATSQVEDGRARKFKSSLPSGGGPFKGFAFVVMRSREDAERVLREWRWEKEGKEEEKEDGEDEEMENAERPDPGTYATLAKDSGMRALGMCALFPLPPYHH